MITKQTTRRAAKILAEQKREYERKFQGAKGDSKAIARVAAEYRSEYGKTPLKRWHNALSQAAKETSSHAAPIRKPAKPASKPVAAPKAAPKKRTSKDDKEAIDLLYRYVVYPLSLNSEMYYTYYYEYKLYDSVKSLVKNQEIKKGLFALIDGCNSFSDFKKEKLKEIIEKTLKGDKPIVIASYKTIPDNKPSGTQKPAKAPLKPKHKLPLHVISKGVLKTVDFERQDPHVVYLNGWTESNGEVCYYYARNGKRVSLKLPESELEKDFVILTKEEAQKRRVAHNKYWEESKRRGEQERAALAAKRKADEKAEKEKFKAAHKTNPDWIKDFAKQTGVSQAVIKAMYAICDNPSRKEDLKLRPVLGGIYCDPDGHLVATDAFILVSVEAKVPKQLAGNIFLKSGQTQGGKYPNYKVILEHKELLPNGKHRVRPYIENKDRKPVQTLTDNWGNKYFNACGGRWREDMYRLILNVFDALGETPKTYHVDAEKEAKYKVANEAFYKDVEFNSIKAKLQATLPMSYISKRVNAIQMPLTQ